MRGGLGDQPGGVGGALVLLGVGSVAVTVLEVDAQVLDRFALQLGAHPGVHVLGESAVEAEDGAEGRGVGGVFVQRGEGLVAPLPDGARR